MAALAALPAVLDHAPSAEVDGRGRKIDVPVSRGRRVWVDRAADRLAARAVSPADRRMVEELRALSEDWVESAQAP